MTRTDVEPKKWGRKAWDFIDSVVEGYDPSAPTKKEEREMEHFLGSLSSVLPCSKCRASFEDYAKRNPPKGHATNRRSVRAWLNGYRKSAARKNTRPGAGKPA